MAAFLDLFGAAEGSISRLTALRSGSCHFSLTPWFTFFWLQVEKKILTIKHWKSDSRAPIPNKLIRFFSSCIFPLYFITTDWFVMPPKQRDCPFLFNALWYMLWHYLPFNMALGKPNIPKTEAMIAAQGTVEYLDGLHLAT